MPPKQPSPFRWQEDPRPSIFAIDPHFRSRQKAGLIEDDDGLKYKQFGTRHLSQIPTPNIHASPNEYNPGDRLFVRRKTKERND
jgi:hypothetical protein